MKRLLFAVVAAAMILLPGTASVTASEPATTFVAHLSGAQEVPATGSAATGRLHLRLTNNDTRLHFRLSANGLPRIVQAHIHIAAKGVNGPVVVFFLSPTTAPTAAADGAVTGDEFEMRGVRTAQDVVLPPGFTFAQIVAALRSGGAYVNIHTPAHPGGEIRGQITTSNEEGD